MKAANRASNEIDVYQKQFICDGTENDISQCALEENQCLDNIGVEINCRKYHCSILYTCEIVSYHSQYYIIRGTFIPMTYHHGMTKT